MTRFELWAGKGLPAGWAENMGLEPCDIVWPIVDTEACGPIDGYPRPEQMLCWCPSIEKQRQVHDVLNAANEFVLDSYRPEPKHDAARFDRLRDALGVQERE